MLMEGARRLVRALVITGNSRLSAKLAEVLRTLPAEVDERGDGETALHAFGSNSYQLVVTDLMLTKVSGSELIRKIRGTEQGQTVPILFMSAPLKDKELPARMARSLRIGPYLQMPFPFDRFLSAAKQAVSQNGRSAAPATGNPAPAAAPVPPTVPGGPRTFRWGAKAAGGFASFEDVMHALRQEGFTGKGRLLGGGKIITVNFQNGLPHAEFTGAGHPLIDDLLKEQLLTDSEAAALRRVAPPAEVERLITGAGVLTPGDLARRRAEYLGIRLSEVMRWPDGALTAESRADASGAEGRYGEVALAHAIAHDVKATTNPLKLATLQNQLKGTWLAPAKELKHFARLLPFTSEEEGVVDALREPCKPEYLARLTRQPEDAWNVIRVLLALRLVTRHSQQPSATETFPLAFRSMHKRAATGTAAGTGDSSVELIDLSGDLAEELDDFVTDLRDKGGEAAQQMAQAGAGDAQRQLENELFDELEKVKKRNYYEMLGTKKNGFKFQDAKKTYFDLQRKFSPDKFIMSSGEVMSKAQELLEKLSAAFETLSDVQKKQAYDQKLSNQQMLQGTGGTGGKELQADVAFQSGLALMVSEEWDSAIRQFEIARQIKPGVALHEASHAWAMYNSPKHRKNAVTLAEAKKMLNSVCVRDPRCAPAFTYRAWMLLDDGKLDLAAMEFGKALRIDPNLRHARQGLDKVEMLRKGQKKGLFG